MQQVNLYLPEFRPRRMWLSLNQALAATVVVLVAVVIWSLSTHWRTEALAEELVQEREDVEQLQAEVDRLTDELADGRRVNIEQQLAELRADVRRREQILELIRQQNLGNAEGFSGQLASLARRSSEALSLSQFSLQDGGQYAELTGRVRTPEALPAYLQRLRHDESFARTRFGVLELNREATGPGLPFSLTRAEADGDEGGGDD